MTMMQAWWDTARVVLVNKGLLVVLAIVIFLIGRKVIHVLMKLFDRVMDRSHAEASIRGFGRKALTVCLYILLVLIILQVVGYEISSFAAILASAGVTIGLALQGSLSNLAGGILILLMRPFRVGDFITAAGYSGTVSEIGLIYTTMITVDNHQIAVPNGTLSGTSIENFSAMETRRVDVDVNVSYATDLQEAKKIIKKVMGALPYRLADQDVDVMVCELGAANIVLEGRVWVNAADYWTAMCEARENLKAAFDAAGIGVAHSKVEMLNK